MKQHQYFGLLLAGLILAGLFWTPLASAQQDAGASRGGTSGSGGSRGGYGGGGGNRSSSSASARTGTGKSPGGYSGPGMAGEAFFQADSQTGKLIVITDEETNKRIKTIIENLDRPVPQVLIKVLFLEVTHSNGLDLGAQGTLTVNSAKDIISTNFGIDKTAPGAVVQILNQDFQATLHALETVGKLNVLSRPSVLTRNNQEATITVGKMVPFVDNSRVTQDGQIINTVVYNDIGIILRVTPYITPDGMIQMDVNPEISTLTGESVPTSNNTTSPVFAKRSAITQVAVPSGRTVVIGGMMQDQKTETVNKVPLLGSIPYLGVLFRHTVISKDKTELLIFLTPQAVESKAGLAEMSAAETQNNQMMDEDLTGEQRRRYLDEKK